MKTTSLNKNELYVKIEDLQKHYQKTVIVKFNIDFFLLLLQCLCLFLGMSKKNNIQKN